MDASHWNFLVSEKQNTVSIRKTKKLWTKRFSSKIWKLFKIWPKISKIQRTVRNIPKNNFIKDNIILFNKAVNKALSAYSKVKNGYYAWWFISWFVKLLRVTNFDCKKCKFLFLKVKVTSAIKQ